MKSFNVYSNVAICFEQGGTDVQMHVHERLKQWRQPSWPQEGDHKFIGWFVTFISVTTSMAK